MLTADPKTIELRIDEATSELAAAEVELQRVLDALLPQERADKTMVSAALREILGRVALAHRKLGDLIPRP